MDRMASDRLRDNRDILNSKNNSRYFRTIPKQYQVLIWPGGGVMLRP